MRKNKPAIIELCQEIRILLNLNALDDSEIIVISLLAQIDNIKKEKLKGGLS